MSNEKTTYPGELIILSKETLPFSIDFSPLLTTGQVLTVPTAALYDITNNTTPGTAMTLTGSPVVSGTSVVQTVDAVGVGLVAGHTYRLVLGAQAAAGIVWQAGTILVCPF